MPGPPKKSATSYSARDMSSMPKYETCRKGMPYFCFHVLGQADHRAGALHDVQGGPVGAANVVHPAVAGDRGHHLDADPLVVVADDPRFAGQVEIAEDVDALLADAGGRARAHERADGVARRAVAVLLRPLEAFRVDGQHGDAFLRGHAAADGLDIVADHADDARRIDEGRFRPVVVDQFDQRLVQLLRPAEDHVLLLQVGAEAQPMQFRARGERSANVPRVGRAADRAMHDVQGVGDRVQHHPRAAEDARPLAHGPGQAGLVAGHVERPLALLMHLVLASFEDFDHSSSRSLLPEGTHAVQVHRHSYPCDGSEPNRPSRQEGPTVTSSTRNSPPGPRGPAGP